VSVARRRKGKGKGVKQDEVHAATSAGVRGDVWEAMKDKVRYAVWEVLNQHREDVMSDAQYADMIKHVASHLTTVLAGETNMDVWCAYEFDTRPTFSDKNKIEIAKGVYVERIKREDEVYCGIEGEEGVRIATLIVTLRTRGHMISSSNPPGYRMLIQGIDVDVLR